MMNINRKYIFLFLEEILMNKCKNILILIVVANVMIMLSACNIDELVSPEVFEDFRTDQLNTETAEEKNDAIMTIIEEATKENNTEKIMAIFSENAIDNNEDIDQKVEIMMQILSGKDWLIEDDGGREYSSKENGNNELKRTDYYYLTIDGREYFFSIVLIIEDSMFPENIGVRSIRISKQEDWIEFMDSVYNDVGDVAIYMYNLDEEEDAK